VVNEVRINEIVKEIGAIQLEQEQANDYIRNLQKGEEEAYDQLRVMLRGIDNEFELCQGDAKLTRLVEERHEILRKLERECGEALQVLEEEQKKVKDKCESDIEELRMEMKRLEMM